MITHATSPITAEHNSSCSARLAKFICYQFQHAMPHSHLSADEIKMLFNLIEQEVPKCQFFSSSICKEYNSSRTTKLERAVVTWQNSIDAARQAKGLRPIYRVKLSEDMFYQISAGSVVVGTEKETWFINHEGIAKENPWFTAFKTDRDEDFASAIDLQPYPAEIHRENYTCRKLAKSVGWTKNNVQQAICANNLGLAQYLGHYTIRNQNKEVPSTSQEDIHRIMAESLEGNTEEKILACCQSQNFGLALWLTSKASKEDFSTDRAKASLRIATTFKIQELQDALIAKGVTIEIKRVAA